MQHGEAFHRMQTPFVSSDGLENGSLVSATRFTLARWALNTVALPHWAPNKYQGKDARINWNVVLVPDVCFRDGALGYEFFAYHFWFLRSKSFHLESHRVLIFRFFMSIQRLPADGQYEGLVGFKKSADRSIRSLGLFLENILVCSEYF